MNYDVYESQTFWDCVAAMRRDDAYKAALMDTLVELRTQPFRNPVLQTHDVGKARNGRKIYSSDVGGRAADRRLIWQLFNKSIVVLLYGTHAVQDRAKRMDRARAEANSTGRLGDDPKARAATSNRERAVRLLQEKRSDQRFILETQLSRVAQRSGATPLRDDS